MTRAYAEKVFKEVYKSGHSAIKVYKEILSRKTQTQIIILNSDLDIVCHVPYVLTIDLCSYENESSFIIFYDEAHQSQRNRPQTDDESASSQADMAGSSDKQTTLANHSNSSPYIYTYI